MTSKLTCFTVVFGVLTLGIAMINAAQTQPPAQTQSRFKARAELVTVPVVVTDKSGAHVPNLKKEDFVVLEDGKEQKLATFEEIQTPAAPLRRSPPQPNQFSNVVPGQSSPTRLVMVVLDVINTPFSDQAYAKRELLKYLADSVDNSQPTSLMVITRSGLKVIHDFTTDPQVLTAALKKVQGQRQLVEEASQEAIPQGNDQVSQEIASLMEFQHQSEQAMESFQRRVAIIDTLEAMQQIAQSAAGLPGRKALIWASAGFPFSINDTTMVLSEGPRLDSLADVLPLYEKTWKALNQSQIAVYPVDVRGLVNAGFVSSQIRNPRSDYYSHAQWQHLDTLGTFQVFAQATGGRAFFNTNDLSTAFRKAAEDNASYYILGYYLDRTGKKTGWHKLGVKVNHEKVQIRARSGFFLAPPETELNEKTAMQLALNSRLAYTAIPITARWQEILPAAEPGKKKVIFVLTLPRNSAEIDESDNNHMVVEFAVLARTGTGVVGDQNVRTIEGHLKPDSVKKIRESGLDYRGALTISPGEYIVHFAVQDRIAGRIGTVIAPLKVAP